MRATTPHPDLDQLLTERFALRSLYGWQREAIDALLAPPGRVLLVAPTGGGKSLCYQLPAVALPGVTLVLSPLISLMEDQVRALEARGIAATFLASSLPWEENGRRLAAIRRGEYKIVYAAPERLASEGFLAALAESELALCAVDEAHCIVQWGHDFRPDYLRVGEVLERLRPPRVLACTATATPDARDEIARRLGLRAGEHTVVLRGFARPNLHLAVREVSGPRDGARAIAAVLREALGSPRTPAGAAIIYAATRKGTDKLAEELRESGWKARPYHAGMGADARARLSAEFADREVPVVVATNAFGMGIDRPDVRLVVHAQPPGSLEGYYQEVGRAGRDGEPARGLLFFSGADIALRRRLCMLGDGGGPATAAEAARAWALFRELLRYVDAATCRHDFILRYFGDEAESLGGCGHCDVCLGVEQLEEDDPEALARDADVVRRALAGVARAKGGAGLQAIAAMLRGERNERVTRMRLDRLSTFGVLAGKPQDEVMGILRALLAAGWIDLTTNEYPVPTITASGWRVMRGEVAARARLPRPRLLLARPRARTGSGPASSTAKAPGGTAPSSAATASLNRDAKAASKRPAGAADGALFDALRAHRAARARKEEVPAYVIAPDRTLAEIAARRPRSEAELAAVPGMGPARMARFGVGMLEVVLGQVAPSLDP